jgi:hypothetical protein
MCYTCGCKLPFEDHGDPRNIVESALIEAGKAKEIKNAGRAEAKRNMLELIQQQQEAGELDNPKKSYAEKTESKR